MISYSFYSIVVVFVILFAALGGLSSAQTVTPPNFTIALIGDQGLSPTHPNAVKVLELIRDEGADMVIHSGDFDYLDDPVGWEKQINDTLGPVFPYFASIGNHDTSKWSVSNGYQQQMRNRLSRIPGANCTGDLGIMSTCTYNGLFFILSGIGTRGSKPAHETYIKNQLAQSDHVWRICSWHKNMGPMQIGSKGDATGWVPYEACRNQGALITTGHDHTYARTKTLINTTAQTIDPAWPDPFNVRVAPNATFVIVSGIAGKSVGKQTRCLPTTPPYGCNGEWASIYTSSQRAKSGALFCSFNVDGQPNKAHCYFKSINGSVPDRFNITSFVGVATSPGIVLTVSAPQNTTYATTTLSVQGSTTVPANVSYSLDGGPIIPIATNTFTFSTLLTNLNPDGHAVSVYAVDSSNVSATDSETVSFTVVIDTQAPNVAITSPLDGATVSGTITVAASATDNVGVSFVDFLVDDVLFGTDNSAPYSALLDTQPLSDDIHELTARAVDTSNNSALHTISVMVNNTIPPSAGIVLEEIKTGGAVSKTSAGLDGFLTLANNNLYVLTSATKPAPTVTGVSGLGLPWTKVARQCGSRSQTAVEVWYALGSPSGNGNVTVTLSSTAAGISLSVSRWSGVDVTDPFGALVSANTLGVSGACSGGSDSSSYSVALTPEAASSMVLGAISHRNKLHVPGAGYTELLEIHHNSGGSASGLAVENKTLTSSQVLTMSGTFDNTVDWSVIGIELKAQPLQTTALSVAVEEQRLVVALSSEVASEPLVPAHALAAMRSMALLFLPYLLG